DVPSARFVDEIGEIQEALRSTGSAQSSGRDVTGQRGALGQMPAGAGLVEPAATEAMPVPVGHQLEARLPGPERLDGRGGAGRDHVDLLEAAGLQREAARGSPSALVEARVQKRQGLGTVSE